MEAKKKIRRVARMQFTKIFNKIESSEGFSHDGEVNFMLLNDLVNKLDVLNHEIEALIAESCDETELEKEFEEVSSYREKWFAIQAKYNKSTCTSSTAHKVNMENEKKYKLPVLETKRFDGDVRNWLPFWGQFEKIDNDNNMDDTDKLQYLLQAMTPGTEVRRFIESFPTTKNSYKQALQDLKNRYARKELLIQVYVRELLSLTLNKEGSQSLTCMYDQMSAQLRALETLGVTKDGYSSFILPMIESALPIEVLRAWERVKPSDVKDELEALLKFLKREVESDQRIHMATAFTQKQIETPKHITASTLVAGIQKNESKTTTCLWCNKSHASMECFKLAKLTLEQRKDHLLKLKACMICLKIGHPAKFCKSYVQCFICKKKHSPVVCPGKDTELQPNPESQTTSKNSSSNLTSHTSSVTLLQTIMVKIVNGDNEMTVRALIDNGSQRSYLRKDVAQKLGIQRSGTETLSHNLFGGVKVKSKIHNVYNISIHSCDNSFDLNATVLEQLSICSNLPKYQEANLKLKSLLTKHNIVLQEDECADISLLIGADYSGFIMTNTMVVLGDNGLLAVKTKLGWVMQGRIMAKCQFTNTLFCSSDVTGFWSLELLGIRDPVESKSKIQAEAEAVMSFEESITINPEGRYEVSLPLKVGHEDLLSNRGLAEKRLVAMTKRLVSSGKFHEYNSIIDSWEKEGIVEKVPIEEIKLTSHYLPHRGVVKDSSLTTKLRPVYDASACDKNGRSLNSYLNKGVNYLDKIPHILTGFRKGAIGISADIAKAFLQVSIKSTDRDYLRFIWWENEAHNNMVEYRHCRVVFGLTSSPFLLSATISHHLKQVTGKDQDTSKMLAKSFYVDNCLTSLDTKEETSKFITEAKEVMNRAKFDLRQWVTSLKEINETGEKIISVLGLLWDTETDKLWCNLINFPAAIGTISKKELMSLIQRIFDPVGFTCPATLTPRLLMQETWRRGLGWDDILPDDLMKEFGKWYAHIACLEHCKIPRRLTEELMAKCAVSLHMFCDASKYAYGACVLLRSETEGRVSVQMFSAKARVGPPENASIARLELTAALMGSRLLAEAKKSLGIEGIKECCWTDSSVALYWITRNLPWNVFVYNRVREIRENSNPSNWHHIPGTLNWADVASRGCNAEQLLSSRWWEGPAWLRLSEEEWPKSTLDVNDTEACKELQKAKTACNASITCMKEGMERLCYFSKYTKIVRMMAWILRFKNNTLHKESKKRGDISVEEYEQAEKKIMKIIQISEEEYVKEQKGTLNTYQDEDGLMRIKTKLLLSDFQEYTKFPILLPAKNTIVRRLVQQRHRELKHAGANQLIVDIRTRFWIIGIRRLAKSVIAACTICTRFKSKKAQAPTAPLPSERVWCTAPFQVSGVDLAGPLFLRNGEKCWVVLFTCAVYRCVHLELSNSLSTEAFMLSLRRFIARRGRVRQIISDNGTNFHGTKNRLSEINWEEVQKRSTVDRIKWKMNAPTAAWWGGFFERLIRIMKELLRRILGQSRVNYEEMETILCECEAVMNKRPLTYVQDDDNNSLEPLTPACFIQCIPESDVTDLDAADAKTLNLRLKYILKLKEDFKQRFKMEYLTTLVQRGKDKATNLKVGDVVLIETKEKRVKWPLGIIEEIYTGNDGIERTAKVKTAEGSKVRPFQRLFPLEVSSSLQYSKQVSSDHFTPQMSSQTTDEEDEDEEDVIDDNINDIMLTSRKTRCGRAVKLPSKYSF